MKIAFRFALCLLASSLSPTDARARATPAPELVAAAPEKGFNYPYLLRLPASAAAARRALLVEPNNTGKVDDKLEVHLEAARDLAMHAIGSSVAAALDLPLLVPVFPRPAADWQVYTHALDRETLRVAAGPMQRLDLQLIAMIADARARLAARGVAVPEKVLLTGFSASGTFVNRFTALHPDLVLAAAGGGLNGVLIVPGSELDGVTLPYPLGVADVAERAGAPFQIESWKRVPQRYYMGAKDDNDAVQYDDGYAPEEKAIVDRVLGAKMQPDRWARCQAIYRESGAAVTFRTYEHAGHFTDDRINDEVADFFRDALAKVTN